MSRIFSLVLCLPLTLSAFTLSLKPDAVGPPEVTLLSSTPQEVELSVEVHGFGVQTVVYDGQRYLELLSPDPGGYTAELGNPKLPTLRRFLEAPFGAAPQVELTVLEEGHLSLTEQGLPPRILPVQPPVPKIPNPQIPFTLNPEAYQKDAFWPEDWVQVEEAGIARGHRLLLLTLYPIRYNPRRGEIRYLARARIRVRFVGGDLEGTLAHLRRLASRPFEESLKEVVLNYGALEGLLDAPPAPIGYLILTPDVYLDSLAPLVAWKEAKGFHVTVTPLSQITPPDTAHILDYIQTAYNNWEIPPTFVLLVGDVDQLPHWVGTQSSSPPTDLYYSTLEGNDYFPDLFVGRFSVANAAQLAHVIRKTVRYERTTWIQGDEWAQRAYFMASDDGSFHGVAEGTHLYCMGIVRAHGMIADSLFAYYNTGTPVATALNDGRSLAVYSGHGSETQWWGPMFTQGQVNALTNTDKYPWVQSYACLTGDFTYSECFMETWLRAEDKGAVVALGSSVTSYWDEDDILQRRIFDVHFDSSVTWVMGAINGGKYLLYLHYGGGGATHRYFEMYNLMGDPSVDLFTQVPETLFVSHPAAVPVGPSILPVSVTDPFGPVTEALVAVSIGDELVAEGYTDETGQVSLPIEPQQPESVIVVVTAHNHKPSRTAAFALSEGAYVAGLRFLIDDDQGNGDSIPNPFEELSLGVIVVNFGNQTASDVEGRLQTDHPGVTLLDSTESFGTLNPGDTLLAPGAFRVLLGDLPNREFLPFDLRFISSEGDTWVSHLSLVVGTPVLSVGDIVVYDAGQIAPNGRLDPGETVDLAPEIVNEGLGCAYQLTAVLRSLSPYVTVLDSIADYGLLLPDTVQIPSADRFRVSADPLTPHEHPAPMVLLISYTDNFTGTVYRDTLTFTLMVGERTAQDPTGPDGHGYYAYDNTDTLYTEAPTFEWVELAGTGTPLSLGDDQTVLLTLPFAFRYYGTLYTQVSVCSNGWIAMGYQSTSNYSNSPIPYPDGPSAMIAPFWDDLNPSAGGMVYYAYDAENARFIVEWSQVPHWGGGGPETFEVILYDPEVYPTESGDGEILFQYLSLSQTNSNTVGIENPQQTDGIQYAFNGTYDVTAAPLAPGRAIKFTTDPPAYNVAVTEGAFQALRFALDPVTPNPFREATRIRFTLPSRSLVLLAVYDLRGRRVRTLLRQTLPAGVYQLRWDGQGDQGQNLPAGVYFLYLKTADRLRVQKVIRVR